MKRLQLNISVGKFFSSPQPKNLRNTSNVECDSVCEREIMLLIQHPTPQSQIYRMHTHTPGMRWMNGNENTHKREGKIWLRRIEWGRKFSTLFFYFLYFFLLACYFVTCSFISCIFYVRHNWHKVFFYGDF